MAAPQTQLSSALGNNHAESGSILTLLEEGAKQNALEQNSNVSNQNKASEVSQRPWDRAITKEELRDSSRNWTLAGDAGLLHYLQDFSQRMVSRTHEIDKIVDGLMHDTKGLDCNVQNTFNDFLMLSNTQFIENRVYDEEISHEDSPADKDEAAKTEKTREQAESEVLPRFSQAVSLGLQVLDDAFITVEIKPEEESDDEEGDANIPASIVADPIIEPKDVYADRPLPHLIGTAEFFHDETVGLVEEPSDDEDETKKEQEEESETETESEKSEQEEESETETESDVTESSDEDIIHKVKKPAKVVDVDTESDDDEDLFGEKEKDADSESDDEPMPKNNLQAELAAKLGLPSAVQRKTSEGKSEKSIDEDTQSIVSKSTIGESHDADTVSVASSVVSKQSKKRTKTRTKSIESHSHKHKSGSKKHHKKQASAEEEDLFAAPAEDNAPFGEPFGQKSGLFSGGGTLFDDNEEQGDLFGDAISTKEDDVATVDEPQTPTEIKPRTRTTSTGKKLPAGAVSIFGDSSPLFGQQSSINEEDKTPAAKKVEKAVPPPVKGLFDDEDDDDALFEETKPTKDSLHADAPIPRKKTLELFDDQEEEDDIFGPKNKAEVIPDKSKDTKESKKIPVGGVSIFGGAMPNLGKDKSSQNIENKSREEPSAESSSLFDDKNSLFSDEPKPAKPQEKPQTTIKPKSKTIISLFDDDEQDDTGDDLFASLGAPSDKNKASSDIGIKPKAVPDSAVSDKKVTAPKPSTKIKSGGLFEDDEDDLFATPAAVPPKKSIDKPLSKTDDKKEPKPKPETKVKSLFDENQENGLFGDSKDLFPSNVKNKQESSNTVPAYVVTVEKTKPKEATMFEHVESDEDDLFGPKNGVSKSSQPVNVIKETKKDNKLTQEAKELPKPNVEDKKSNSNTAKGKNLAGLFDDGDEADFLSPATSSKPKPEEKKIKTSETPKNEDIGIFGSPQQVPTEKTKPPEIEAKPEPVSAKPRKPPGAVSLFGGIDPFAAKKKLAQDSGSVKDDGFKDTVDTGKPDSVKQKEVETVEKTQEEDLPKITGSTPGERNIGQLQKSLNFNPAALLPGASPPIKKPEPTEATFDKPPEFKTLQNAGKDRVRVQSKRRPPSRGARRVAAQTSTEELFPSSEPLDNSITSITGPSPSPNNSDLIFGPPSISNSSNFLDNMDSSHDTVHVPVVTASDTTSRKESQTEKVVHDIFGRSTTDDIFGDLPSVSSGVTKAEISNVATSGRSAAEDLFGTAGTQKPAESSVKAVNDYESDEDLFAVNTSTVKPTTKPAAAKSVDTVSSATTDTSEKASAESTEIAPAKKTKKEEQKKSPKKAIKKWDDNDLFGDSGSIFDDIPSKSKEKKKKKSDASKDIFADSGDIFSSPKSTTEKKTKPAKKKTEKAAKPTKTVFDENAPSIFDDPLNALGGD